MTKPLMRRAMFHTMCGRVWAVVDDAWVSQIAKKYVVNAGSSKAHEFWLASFADIMGMNVGSYSTGDKLITSLRKRGDRFSASVSAYANTTKHIVHNIKDFAYEHRARLAKARAGPHKTSVCFVLLFKSYRLGYSAASAWVPGPPPRHSGRRSGALAPTTTALVQLHLHDQGTYEYATSGTPTRPQKRNNQCGCVVGISLDFWHVLLAFILARLWAY